MQASHGARAARLALGLALLPFACSRQEETVTTPPAERARRIEEMFQESRKLFPEVPLVLPAELATLQAKEKIVLVDVREPAERAVSILPSAISKADFERTRDAHRGDKVVAYCTIGHRSGLYAKDLRRQGIDAHDLAGSILAWTHAGLPLVGPDGAPTRRVHVNGSKWNLVADGYEGVW